MTTTIWAWEGGRAASSCGGGRRGRPTRHQEGRAQPPGREQSEPGSGKERGPGEGKAKCAIDQSHRPPAEEKLQRMRGKGKGKGT